MTHMRRTFTAALGAIALVLVLPALSGATLTEVGEIGTTTPETEPSCPKSPCLAVSRTTGFQVKVSSKKSIVSVPRAGSIVAWTISLGKPTTTQIKYFNLNEGGAAEAGIAVLRPQKKIRAGFKLIAQSPLVELEPYFGETAEFPLETTIKVRKRDIIALTVPTWAPALALGFANNTSWRASRPKKGCSETSTQTTQTEIGTKVQYLCLYRTARLTYSATLISTP